MPAEEIPKKGAAMSAATPEHVLTLKAYIASKMANIKNPLLLLLQ
jgi:hypothetical protein